MRVITLIVIHCSAVKPDQTSSAAQIDTWHRKDRHYKFGIGYHYVIRRGLDIRGQPDDTRTAEQKATMRLLLEDLHQRYPRALVVGHHDLDPKKACPCFDVVKEFSFKA